jgi:HK97 family phage major capsid protein/HK97 family phage prohead protease
MASIDAVRADEDDNKRAEIDLSFSSEEPVERFFGAEILDHENKSVRLEFLTSGRAPLLLDHNTGEQIGVVTKAEIVDRVGRASVRFGNSARAKEVFDDVRDGIRSNVSVGYHVHRMILEEESDEGDRFRVMDWEPMEVSIVSIPADQSVGVGRSGGDGLEGEIETLIQRSKMEVPMTKHEKIDLPEGDENTDGNDQTTETRREKPQNTGARVTVDADQVLKNERKRIAEIDALAKLHDQCEIGERAVGEGWTLERFQNELLTKLGEAKPEQNPNHLGLTRNEANEFSFMKLVRHMAYPTDQKLRDAAGFELECSRAVAEQIGRDPTGAFIPLDAQLVRNNFVGQKRGDLEKRDLTSTATTGGELIGTDHLGGSFIELLRNATMVRQMGARVLENLTGNISIPKLVAGAAGSWVAENAAASETTQTTGEVNMNPKTVTAYTEIGRRLMIQSDPSVEQLIREDLAASVGLAVDQAAISGSGTDNQPTGILNTSGIGAVTDTATNGGAIDWSKVVDLEKEVAIDNALMQALYYLTNPKVVGSMKQTPKQSSGVEGNFILDPDRGGRLNGYPVGITNQVPSNLTKGAGTNLSAMIFGNFRDLIIAEWGTLDVLVDRFADSTKGLTRVSVFLDADIAVRHAQSFAACQDIVAS